MTSSKLTPAQQALVEKYLYLVTQVINAEFFISYTNVEMNIDDLTQMGRLALCKAALNYNNTRPFPPFAKTVIRNALFDYARRLHLQSQHFCYLSDEVEANLSYTYDYPEVENYLMQLEETATGIQKKGLRALRMKLTGYTAVDISKEFGVTPSAVGFWMKHSKEELRTNANLQELLS